MDTLTITQLCKATGVSREKLYCCEKEGLVMPVGRTEGNYRLYDSSAIGELRKIMRYQSLHFTLKEIADIFKRPDSEQTEIFNRKLDELKEERKHLDRQIFYTKLVRTIGSDIMFSEAFDDKSIDEIVADVYSNRIFRRMTKKVHDMSDDEILLFNDRIDAVFARFAELKGGEADSDEAFELVDEFFNVLLDGETFRCVFVMNYSAVFSGNGEFHKDVNKRYGSGTAEFMAEVFECRWIYRAFEDVNTLVEDAVENSSLADDEFAAIFTERVCGLLNEYIGDKNAECYEFLYDCMLSDPEFFSCSGNKAVRRLDAMMKNYYLKGDNQNE